MNAHEDARSDTKAPSWAARHHVETGHATAESLNQPDACLECSARPPMAFLERDPRLGYVVGPDGMARDPRWEHVEGGILRDPYGKPGVLVVLDVTVDGQRGGWQVRLDEARLAQWPGLFGHTLERMVRKIDDALDEREHVAEVPC